MSSTTLETKSADTKSANFSVNTVIMFDWDDTLLPSTFLSTRAYQDDCVRSLTSLNDKNDILQLQTHEQYVVALLKLALSYGIVNIITNAEVGWVELSAHRFMPAVLPLLSSLTIMSARSIYEDLYPEEPMKWKYYAFHDRLRAQFGESYTTVTDTKKNIISFGDSHVERSAILAITKGLPNCYCKSMKFAEQPTIEHLFRQLELITKCFGYIMIHTGDLDLQLTVDIHVVSKTT